MSAPSASVVSRFLGQHFRRSEREGRGPAGIPLGFTVRPGLGELVREVDWVVVEFEPGYHLRARLHGHPELLLKNTQKVLKEYEEKLAERYDVSRNDEDGSDEWNCLIVRHKKTEEEKS